MSIKLNDFGSMRCFVTKIMSFYDENVISSWNILIFNDDYDAHAVTIHVTIKRRHQIL